jgi:hypothetical protein
MCKDGSETVSEPAAIQRAPLEVDVAGRQGGDTPVGVHFFVKNSIAASALQTMAMPCLECKHILHAGL